MKTLVVTGNPFAITGDENNYMALKNLMLQKGGQLVNETLNAPAYLRRGASRGARQAYPVGAGQNTGGPLMITQEPASYEEGQLFPKELGGAIEQEHDPE